MVPTEVFDSPSVSFSSVRTTSADARPTPAGLSVSSMGPIVRGRDSTDDFGGSKTITYLGSVFLLVNNSCGPGLALLPGTFQQGGWLFGLLGTLVLMAATYMVGRMLVESVKNIPDNEKLDSREEYLDLVRFYCEDVLRNQSLSYLIQFLYYLFMISLLISNIIQTSQVVDFGLVNYAGHSYGLEYYPQLGFVSGNCLDGVSPFECGDENNFETLTRSNKSAIESAKNTTTDSTQLQMHGSTQNAQQFVDDSAFNSLTYDNDNDNGNEKRDTDSAVRLRNNVEAFDSMKSATDNDRWNANKRVISLGYALVTVAIVPVCLMNLDSSIYLQYLAAIALVCFCIIWTVFFGISPEFARANVGVLPRPMQTLPPLPYSVLSTNFFNIAFVATMPSWLNEKKESVNSKYVLRCVGTFLFTAFIVLGAIGGMAFYPYYNRPGINLLDKLNNFGRMFGDTPLTGIQAFATVFAPVTVTLFPLCLCITSIPVYCVCIRYNLLSTGALSSVPLANCVAVLLPFTACIPLYYGTGFTVLCNWTGVILSSCINFLFPIYFYYVSVCIHTVLTPNDSALKSTLKSTLFSADKSVRTIRTEAVGLKLFPELEFATHATDAANAAFLEENGAVNSEEKCESVLMRTTQSETQRLIAPAMDTTADSGSKKRVSGVHPWIEANLRKKPTYLTFDGEMFSLDGFEYLIKDRRIALKRNRNASYPLGYSRKVICAAGFVVFVTVICVVLQVISTVY